MNMILNRAFCDMNPMHTGTGNSGVAWKYVRKQYRTRQWKALHTAPTIESPPQSPGLASAAHALGGTSAPDSVNTAEHFAPTAISRGTIADTAPSMGSTTAATQSTCHVIASRQTMHRHRTA
jgi:hypothetical protein